METHHASRSTLAAGVAVCVSAMGGCHPLEAEAGTLGLLRFAQAQDAGVFLNEPLIFHFDGEVDPTSVTRETVRITRPDGRPAGGEFEVHRRQLRFQPSLPRAGDLSDGGFLPGTTYTVELRGFPLPDGLRDRVGQPLAATVRTSFRTAERDAPGGSPLFADASIDGAEPLLLRTPTLRPGEPLVLECEEPLDPTTLFADDFQFRVFDDGALPRIDLRADLVVNRADLARIELHPVAGDLSREPFELRPGDGYFLVLDTNSSRLRDFGGHSVPPGWSVQAAVRVEETEEASPIRSLHVDFLPPFRPTPEEVAGCDGGLAWDGDVTVTLPRSCGTGADGAVELDGGWTVPDLHATRVHLASDRVASIEAEGVVVLRSQGRMEIAGRLERGGGALPDGERPSQVLSDWLRKRRAEPSSSADAHTDREVLVDEWIDHLRERNLDYTLLVAGGDLVVSGEIEVDGPLLLVAGGLIRATGSVRAQRAHRVGRGGGPRAKLTPLGLDQVTMVPLRENVLADSYRFGVRSSPIRPPGGVRRWLTPVVKLHEGLGSVRVRYLGERPGGGPDGTFTPPVEDPATLAACDALRLLIEIEVGPGKAWDPPRVDFIELRYE